MDFIHILLLYTQKLNDGKNLIPKMGVYPQKSKDIELNVICVDKQDCNRLTRGCSVYIRGNAKLGVLIKSWISLHVRRNFSRLFYLFIFFFSCIKTEAAYLPKLDLKMRNLRIFAELIKVLNITDFLKS